MTYAAKMFSVFIFTNLFVMHMLAQTTMQDSLQSQFDAYRQNQLQEKIYLHTDKEFYLAGEICWFKIYAVDAFFHAPLGISKVAYVEVLDTKNKPVLQAKISISEGFGNGSLYLPFSLISGNYKLRAYTNWMKNFGADYFFEKPVTIVNSQKIYVDEPPVQKDSFDVKFFPEGGNLVNGIQSKIAFRVVDQAGKGAQCEGVILNNKADTIVKCEPLKFGIGNFMLTPEMGQTYKAVLTFSNGKKIVQELPAAFNNGYVMHLEEADSNQIKITVQQPSGNSLSSGVYLFAHTRSIVKLSLSGRIQDGAAIFLINKNKLGDGINHLTVFDEKRRPVCERLYFKYPQQIFQAGATLDAPGYDLRKKIKVDISSVGNDGKPVLANMSMAVYLIDSLQGISDIDINNYLWLSSDLEGKIESPGFYFNSNGVGTGEAIDNLMLTLGWRRFRWEDILQQKKSMFEFIPEYTGHIVTGNITNTVTGLPAKLVNCYLSVPGTRTQFRSSVSDNEGHIKFELADFYNRGEVIVQTNSRLDSIYNIEIVKPFSEKYSGSGLPGFSLLKLPAGALANHNIGLQVQGAYNGSKQKLFAYPNVDTTAFYYKPDATYLLDNYVRFTTMEEVLREYVVQVNVRKKNGEFHLHVLNGAGVVYFEADPLVLIDGVPVFDMNKFLNYDPLKIRKLEVVSNRYYLGNTAFEGIVNFVTYSGNLEGYEIDPHAVVIDYEGLQMQREFYSPVYETQQQVDGRLPDFRNLLYWNPEVKTNKNGKQEIVFYSSDIHGKYAVVIQGLTADGKTGSKVVYFDVKKP
ncbi:hypothetical protein [Flavihumibacter profundi]|uniref:hypothetical protein n=1 Tax=Flavihumibacter profundi TaxID=2716883 RepID=UPI001CC73B46|nr:hypothetical protein [Flavihumibacter profundi]MBZ5859351.1 hypothetical protein [Flavihumibacter profundi]